MKKLLLSIALVISTVAFADDSPRFMMKPSLSPDSEMIYFEYDTDIWRVPVKGGIAARIVAMEGYETSVLASPDGKWIAFASNKNGNNDVFMVSVEGGQVRQLTFSDANDVPVSWSPDSKSINFESNIYNSISAYNLSINGGTPKRLFDHYFNTIANLWEMHDGNYLFNESTESYRYATRKGYKGDHNANIKLWNPKSKEYTELTDYNGKDIWPSSDKNGNIYFASDMKNGQANLMRLENSKPITLTSFKESIQYPKVGYNGDKVVFNLDYKIYVFDTKTSKAIAPKIVLSVENPTNMPKRFNVSGTIGRYDVSPDGKKIAFASRGRLFVSDIKGQVVRELNTSKDERVVELKWGDDNKTIYFTRTRAGYNNLYSIDASSSSSEKKIYEPDTFVKNLAISHKGNKLAFVTGGDKLESFDGGKIVTLSKENEFWTFRGVTLAFSHDDNYLIFNSMNLFESDVFVYDFRNKKVHNITNSASSETSPVISSDNRKIFLLANRYSGTFPRGASYGGTNVFEIPLNKYSPVFNNEKYSQLFEEKSTSSEETPEPINIDLENITRRWRTIQSTNPSGLSIINHRGDDYLIYNSRHEGRFQPYLLKLDESENNQPKAITGVNSISSPVVSNGNLYVSSAGAIYSVNISNLRATKINISFEFEKNNADEFKQMFYEAWAQMKESFYDPKMHNVDWEERLEYYEDFLPYVQTRGDLRIMSNDMMNELNSSHLGFNSRGSEEQVDIAQRTVHTGIMFDNSNPYSVDYIVKDSPADKIDLDIRKGDILTKINDVVVDEKQNRNLYFTSVARQDELTLTFKREGSEFNVNIKPISGGALKNLLYFEWEDSRRAIVSEQTKDKVAYVHLRDMTDGSLNRFFIEMNTDAVHKDALILDLRFNNGGNIHNEILEYLSQKSYFTWRFRDQQSNTHPNNTPGDKPIVVLINERSLSDAEVTSNGIRNLGIAKLIGTETYRWIIFTSSVGLMDGSSIRMPAWGCYNLDGSDLELTGVKPDIYIKNTFEDRLNGVDPQLAKAIEEILKDLK